MKKYEHNYGKNPEGVLSTTSGYATETTNFGEAAFGILNKSTRDKSNFTTPEVVSSSTATLFSVGNGSDGIRKNIIELKADGTVLISGVGEYDGTNPDDATGIADKMQGIEGIVDGLEESIDSINIVKDETSDLIYTLMVDGEERGSINIPKDQFLKSVTYNEDTNELIFTFVTSESDNKEVRVNMTDLVDTYTAGDGLNLEGGQFSIKVDADTQSYIEVTANGVKIVGINEAFNNCVTLDGDQTITGNKTFNTDVIATGFAVPEGTSDEVLTADGDSNTLKTINGQTLLGNGDVDMSEFATQGDVADINQTIENLGDTYATKDEVTEAVGNIDLSNYVTLDSKQTINGRKTFSDQINIKHTPSAINSNTALRIQKPESSGGFSVDLVRNESSTSSAVVTIINSLNDITANNGGALRILNDLESDLYAHGVRIGYKGIMISGNRASSDDQDMTLTNKGITITGKTTSDLLNAGGSTTPISDIITQIQESLTVATSSADGLMSAADKTKLDSIDTQNLATKSEVNAKVGGTGVSLIQVVATLPDVQEEGVLYIVTGKGA